MSRPRVELHLGDCLDVLPTLPDASVDCVVTDPPYPCIKRPYGTWTEAEWHALMDVVVPECRRVLKPAGSAVFILQPNSERVGRMRLWLWEFMVKWGREWGVVQDAYWWNHTALPLTKNDPNLMRPSVKTCVWLGRDDCYRDASDIRWEESADNLGQRMARRCFGRHEKNPNTRANVKCERIRSASERLGGVTPFNVLPCGPDGKDGKFRHAAKTPLLVADWWVRYLCPPGGTVLDPFLGSGTVALAALKQGKSAIGVEAMPEYVGIARRRIDAELDTLALLEPEPIAR